MSQLLRRVGWIVVLLCSTIMPPTHATDEAIRVADVEVASQVGTWAGDSFGILPPPAG